MSREMNPLALVDRDGVVWPWDGREVNEYLVDKGSRYLYTEEEVQAARAAYKASLKSMGQRRLSTANDPSAKPGKRKRVGTANDVRKAVLATGTESALSTLD